MNIVNAIRESIFVPIHPSGWPFIVLFVIVGIILTIIWTPLLTLAVIMVLWCVYFFRNPVRLTPLREGLIIAPADGKVLGVEELPAPDELDLPATQYIRISIFMNVFDCHVNRAPIAGVVTDRFYFPGEFLDASFDKASILNERLGIVIETDSGKKIGCVQVAGLIARRILCDAVEGDRLQTGEQYGIIRFGSRVDVWLPKPCKTLVLGGQHVIAGETVLADYARGAKSIDKGEAR